MGAKCFSEKVNFYIIKTEKRQTQEARNRTSFSTPELRMEDSVKDYVWINLKG
jgi:hypothetical protein